VRREKEEAGTRRNGGIKDVKEDRGRVGGRGTLVTVVAVGENSTLGECPRRRRRSCQVVLQ
jgi:hypothetical protein